MYDVLIIGHGPAGISAALYTLRANLNVLIIGKDNGALQKAHLIENYYGIENPISGEDLVDIGIKQAKNLGAIIKQEEVIGIDYQEHFTVKTNKSSYDAKTIIIATGSSRKAPRITGVKEFEGKGVSYCAVCDAFFYRDKDVAVIGEGDYAVSEAMHLLPIAKSVTILTNAKGSLELRDDSIKINEKPLKSIEGDNLVREVRFADNTSINVDGVFVAEGVATSTDLANKLGVLVNENKISVDDKMHTNIPGLFAAGDCTGGMLQVAKAVYEGALAGTEAIKFLRKEEN